MFKLIIALIWIIINNSWIFIVINKQRPLLRRYDPVKPFLSKGSHSRQPSGQNVPRTQITNPNSLQAKRRRIQTRTDRRSKWQENRALLREEPNIVFNAEFIPESLREDTEALIQSTSRHCKIFYIFMLLQFLVDLTFTLDSIYNRNTAYIEMSRFYAEIGPSMSIYFWSLLIWSFWIFI